MSRRMTAATTEATMDSLMVFIECILLALQDYLRYKHNHTAAHPSPHPRLRRMSLARRRARYAARWQRTQSCTGTTQRLG
jgi:hypothetical protein